MPAAEVEVPEEVVDEQIERLRLAVAELVPAEGRPAREGDTVIVDLVGGDGTTQRDFVIDIGAGQMIEELDTGLVGLSPGHTKEIEQELADGSTAKIEVTVKDVKERVLPPLDDELARAASEFDTLAELRADLEPASASRSRRRSRRSSGQRPPTRWSRPRTSSPPARSSTRAPPSS